MIGHEKVAYFEEKKKGCKCKKKAKRPSITGLNIAIEFAGGGAKRINYRRRDLFMKGLGQTSEWWVHILTRVILPSVLEYGEFREGCG